jgi:DNA sulfur modification protein DndD
MIIGRISLTNFQAYRELDLTLDPPRRGRPLVLLFGLNGSGKTTFQRAVRVALWGERGWERDKTLINFAAAERGEEVATVCLELAGEKGLVSITRVLRQVDGGIREDLSSVELKPRTASSGEKIPQDWLADLFPEQIREFFLFDGEQIQKYAEADAAEQLRESVDILLGLTVFDRLLGHLGEARRRYHKTAEEGAALETQAKRKQVDLEQIQSEIQSLQEQVRDLKKDEERFREEEETLRKKIPEAIRRETEESLGPIKNRIIELEKEEEETEAALLKSLGTTVGIEILLGSRPEIFDDFLRERDKAQRVGGLAAVLEIAPRLAQVILRQGCPACEIPAPEGAVERLAKAIEDALREVFPQDTPSLLTGMSPGALGEAQRALGGVREGSVASISEMLEKLHRIQGDLEQLREKERRVSELLRHKERYETLFEKWRDANQNLGKVRQEIAGLQRQLQEKSTRRRQIEGDLEGLRERIAGTSKQKRVMVLLNSTIDAVSALRNQYRKKIPQELAERMTEMLQLLAHKKEMLHKVEIEPDTFEIRIVTSRGGTVRKDDLSPGEKQVYAVSLIWALGRVSGFSFPVIIDTPMARLDSRHRRAFVENYLPRAAEQVFVLSSDTELLYPDLATLRPFTADIFTLEYDQEQRKSTIQRGYHL